MTKYTVSDTESWEPGSNESVLKNKLELVTEDDVKDIETDNLYLLYTHIFEVEPRDYEVLSMSEVCYWHRVWLGNIYEWAGTYRQVNMAKPDMDFAGAKYIQSLSTKFEQDYLNRFSGLPTMDRQGVIQTLAESHVEFILIHPFREGNGRISRLLMDVMAIKAGYELLDYSIWDKHKDFYFKAIQAGRDGDYRHIGRLVKDVLTPEENRLL
jgi:cell filamentation protein